MPDIQKSVEQLGFKFSDIKILLGNHAHGDHQEGDALVKQLTGAQVMAMAEDVPALQAIKPGGKAHPIDRMLHDGETVTLGGTTLVAHLTPGHTRGCTTWTMKAQEGGKTYNVVFGCSFASPGTRDARRSSKSSIARSRRAHAALRRAARRSRRAVQHARQNARLKPGAANPFVDPANCKLEAAIAEAMFRAALKEQSEASQGAPPARLAQTTMSPEATVRAHLQEINVETAMKLVNACIAYSKAAASATGGAERGGRRTVAATSWPPCVTDGQTPKQLGFRVSEGEDRPLHGATRAGPSSIAGARRSRRLPARR